ncbi:MAG TPA: hypothetical protein VLU46_16285, partial [Thermoanaerobaculia bacterium]|nr:hypothetical protein [Thermoanaerobaculia bacterium]
MTKLIRDPKLDELVRALNEGSAATKDDGRSLLTTGIVAEGEALEPLLREMMRRDASDLLLVAGAPPVLRVNGTLVRSETDPLTSDDIHDLFATSIGSRVLEHI